MRVKKLNWGTIILLFFLIGLMVCSEPQAEDLKGKITFVKGDVIELNLGSEKGIKLGDSGLVYYTTKVGEKKETISVAKFRITDLSEKSSRAQIEDKTGDIKVDYLVKVELKTGQLDIRSAPSGAKVFLDGRERGKSPVTISDIQPGRHQIRLTKEGYDPYEEWKDIGTGPNKIAVELKKMVSEGKLVVRTEPSEATIYLDGRLVGKSPYEGKGFSPRGYKVRVTKEGYETWDCDVVIEAVGKVEVFAKLREKGVDWTQKKFEAPLLKVGDQWTYKDATGLIWTDEVVDDKEGLYILKRGGVKYLLGYNKKTMNETHLIREGGKPEENKSSWRKFLDFPIFVGKTWTGTTTRILTDGKSEVTFVSDFKIEEIEEVITPAGTLRAFRILYRQTNKKSGNNGCVRYWFSPEVKAWVKREFDKSSYWAEVQRSDAELISYRLK